MLRVKFDERAGICRERHTPIESGGSFSRNLYLAGVKSCCRLSR